MSDPNAPNEKTNEPRELLAGLHLLDHQILDCDGWMAGNVDDLELEVGDDPTAEPPTVVALLSGGGALARRLEGRLGRWLESVARRLAEDGEPAQIPFEMVERIGSHVNVIASRDDLETNRGEHWARVHLIEPIPGAGHAPE